MAETSADPREVALDRLRGSLQSRVLGAWPLPGDVTADELWRALKRWLYEAHQGEFLLNPSHEIHEYMPRPVKIEGGYEIHGGLIGDRRDKKDFKRLPGSARLRRDDGAWLHFTLTLKCDNRDRVREIFAYDFELVFPEGHHPRFVRFDLNKTDHENEVRWIRCHMHPGNDDLMLPAPVMSPEELLDVLLRRLRPRDAAKPRA